MFLREFYERYQQIFYLKPLCNTSPFEGPSKPLRSQEQDQEKEQEQEEEQEQEIYSAELPSSSPPVAEKKSPIPGLASSIAMPLNDNTEFIITLDHITEWQALYPAVDVMQTLRHIRGWNLANPKKRKTKNGILKHITQWLAKEQDKGPTVMKSVSKNRIWDHNASVAMHWLDKAGGKIINGEVMT